MNVGRVKVLLFGLIGVLIVVLASGWAVRRSSRPIRLGLLHSLHGPMAISEKAMMDAEILAIEEINRSGGIDGREVVPVIADGQSDPAVFAKEAERLVRHEKVSSIIGCWTSASRKAVRNVVERHKNLLIYPMAFEGMELSRNVVYVGATANQQVIPTVNWAREALGKRFYLAGSDYIWPHVVSEIAKDQIALQGGIVAGEGYIPYGSNATDALVADIVQKRPDVILSTIAGESNLPFYRNLYEQGLPAGTTNVVSLSMGVSEASLIPRKYVQNHYAAWSYFQSIDRPENLRFVENFKQRYGPNRLINDVDQSSYLSVYLWRQALLEAGSDQPEAILESIAGQSVGAPEGIVSIDRASHYAWRSLRIGKLNPNGQFDIVWSANRPISPMAYPTTRPQMLWDELLGGCYKEWGGNWVNPKGRVAGRE